MNSILENAPFGFAFLDRNFRFVTVNNVLASQTGFTPEDHANKPLKMAFGKNEKEIAKMCRKVIRTGSPILNQEFSIANLHAEVANQHWLISCLPVRNQHSRIWGIALIISDITERKKISLQKNFQAHLLQNISDAVVSTDLHYRILSWNKAAEHIYGWKSEEVIGRPISEVVKSRAVGMSINQVRKTVVQEGQWNGELFQTRKDGKELNMLSSLSVFRDTWNEVVGVVAVNRDITDRKISEQNLQKAVAAREEFMSIASHELKTPLTTIKAFMQLLQRKLISHPDSTLMDYTRRIDVQITKLTQLIKDLLDTSKIESGKLSYNRQVFSLSDLVSEIVEDFQPLTKTHKITLKNVAKVYVEADRDRIGQVLLNFLGNAIKYSPNAGEVSVVVKLLTKEVKVSVSDKGVGVNKQDQEHVFERFFRAADLEAGTMPSLGLGLYISAAIMKSHKGKIGLTSKKGKGSTFFFTLPVYKLKK